MAKKQNDQSNTAPPIAKWQIVENVVAALERVIGIDSTWTVTQNVMIPELYGNGRRQIDVLVECPSGARVFRVGIDVKNEKRPLTVECVEQLCRKRAKIDVDRYIIVSTAGFTKEGQEEADACRVETKTIEELDVSDVIQVTHITIPTPKIDRVDIVFDVGSEPIAAKDLLNAIIRINEEDKPVRELSSTIVGNFLAQNQHLQEGGPLILDIENQDCTWSNLRIKDKDYGPPDSMHIYFIPYYEKVLGYRFRTHSNVEMITAVVPTVEGPKQFTLVLTPEPNGGYRPTVSWGEIKPPRRKL